jgi:hypothetical protein
MKRRRNDEKTTGAKGAQSAVDSLPLGFRVDAGTSQEERIEGCPTEDEMAYAGRADNETLRALKRSGDDETTKEQHTDWRATKQRARVRDKGTSGREEELTLKGRNDDDTSRLEDHQLTGKPRNDEDDERTTGRRKRGRKDERTK